ncbi:family 43 glycoside hydrolase [Collybia nuda]|uniref:Family 43 glycoside hydrolase n=1 Tax=Collybia nuda TaxID=64659 RepID=A0A9P5YEK0_9AGAR|nr:family 43 glycoside hydrolase [Collybia nuda]
MKISTLLTGVTISLSTIALAYTNPVLWNDLADVDVRNVNGTYYYSASTMHYSPGAPILRSYDLFNWEFVGHSVPNLADFGTKYNLQNGQRAYVNGIWASWFDFNQHDGKWYWGGCIDFARTFIYTASKPEGPWTRLVDFSTCMYDSGLLIDDDGTPYVSYKSGNFYVAQLSKDFKTIVSTKLVYTLPSDIASCEGTRPYKRDGKYYIFTDDPSTTIEYVLMSSNGVWGPYTKGTLTNGARGPVTGVSNPVQGSLIKANNGQWYYMCFTSAYPTGRIPVLAPLNWGSDGWPSIQLVNGNFGTTYPDPETAHPVPAYTGTDSFSGTSLGNRWEWNHTPDTSRFTVNNSLTLRTATVTVDFYSARNTLTQRIPGQSATATIIMEFGSMLDGDRAGLAMVRDMSFWVGISKDNGIPQVRVVSGINMDTTWKTVSTGATAAIAPINGTTVWLRAKANVAPSSDRTAQFSYSTDGTTFKNIGNTFAMNTDWRFFLGYRFGIFNYATSVLGGSVKVRSYDVQASGYVGGGGGTTLSLTDAVSPQNSGAAASSLVSPLYG